MSIQREFMYTVGKRELYYHAFSLSSLIKAVRDTLVKNFEDRNRSF